MPEYRWLAGLRPPVRARVFQLLKAALGTTDGRRILVDSLEGLTAPGHLPPAADLPREDYPELPTEPTHARTAAPVFLTARFRSGSTLLWNLFRHVPGVRAYYEPLNERRWFDPSARGTRIDRTHVGVDEYWAEYEGLAHLSACFRDDWNHRCLYLERHASEPDLAEYINGLIDAAPERAVLQFNRVDFRLPWLRARFPHARLIHLYRHPRDQWCSSLVDPASFTKDGTIEEFRAHDHFYLLPWAEDLSHRFPLLDPRRARHPYELFYYIWRLSYDFGQAYADASFGLERLCASPRTEIPRLMDAAGVEAYDLEALARLVLPARAGKWRAWAHAAWFDDIETRCEMKLRLLRPLDAADR